MPRCASCHRTIPVMSSIAEDIRNAGGAVPDIDGLDATMYRGTMCTKCHRLFCYSCHNCDHNGFQCPSCHGELSPLFADML